MQIHFLFITIIYCSQLSYKCTISVQIKVFRLYYDKTRSFLTTNLSYCVTVNMANSSKILCIAYCVCNK